MLKGLQEFGKTAQEKAETGVATASILGKLSGSLASTAGATPAKSSSKLVATGPGLPALPKKIAEQILAGSYVAFSKLPPAKGRTSPMLSPEEGQIVLVRAEDLTGTRKLIPDLGTWLQCFALYMAVVMEKEPERTKHQVFLAVLDHL